MEGFDMYLEPFSHSMLLCRKRIKTQYLRYVHLHILISLSLKFVYILIYTECFISIYEVLLSVSYYVMRVYFLMSLVAHRFRGVEFRISKICFDFFKCSCLKKTTENIRISTCSNRWATKDISLQFRKIMKYILVLHP